MRVTVEFDHQFLAEMRRTPDLSGMPLSSRPIPDDLLDLVEEAVDRSILADELPGDINDVHARVEPVFSEEPRVERIRIALGGGTNGSSFELAHEFTSGRWVRTSLARLAELRAEGTVGENEPAYRMIVALPQAGGQRLDLPNVEPPRILDGALEWFGVREATAGELVPDRPVLVNERLVREMLDACLDAGVKETGRAVLGAHVRLPEPLPNTTTRIVTVLTACIDDHRHTGVVNEWKISPEALADAANIADVRGCGESVLTVVHTHGWNRACGKCNQNANCPLAECTEVSVMDYQVLETLFPSKATLMPIAGRKLGAPDGRPVLEIHAWRGGAMRPIRWRQYRD
jgi:hypothetical protein